MPTSRSSVGMRMLHRHARPATRCGHGTRRESNKPDPVNPAASVRVEDRGSRIEDRIAECRDPRSSILDPRLLVVALLLLPTGCGYMVGGPYRRDVETVHVPIFTSTSFRRDVELQLTEAVHREIQKRTHYRLVKGPHADTRLTGRITRIRKRVLGESADDGGRELQFEVSVIVTWQDLRNNEPIVNQRTIQLDPDAVRLLSHSSFTPETGGSLATARKRAIDNLARQVVTLMETPW